MWHTINNAIKALAPLSGALLVQSAAGTAEEIPFSSFFPHGLVTKDAAAKYYTASLDLRAPLLLRGSGDFMAAARADARLQKHVQVKDYLAQSSKKRTLFLDNESVWGFEEIETALHQVFAEKGQLVMLMGGKSLGKTALLKELAGRKVDILGLDGAKRSLLYVDARSCGGDLAKGLVAALQREMLAQEKQLSQSSGDLIFIPPAKSVALDGLNYKGAAINNLFELSGGPSEVDHAVFLLSKVLEAANSAGRYLCLIIDEAPLVFSAPPDPLSQPLSLKHLATHRQLEKLVELTKQNRQMNVLLVSSDFAYPYSLQNGHVFNATNLTRTLFAGEVSPSDMRTVLQEKWGLGPNLCKVFLAFYGGHVHMASQALALLSQQLDDFDCLQVAPKGLSSSISACLSANDGGAMVAMLTTLAQRGFVPVGSAGNASAQAISRANIGGLVETCDTVVGLPQGHREGTRYGLVPSSQFVVSNYMMVLGVNVCNFCNHARTHT